MSHTPSFQKAAETLLGHTGLSSESREAALLPRGSAGHHRHCRIPLSQQGLLWVPVQLGIGGSEPWGAPEQSVDAGHTSLSDVSIWLGCKLTG